MPDFTITQNGHVVLHGRVLDENAGEARLSARQEISQMAKDNPGEFFVAMEDGLPFCTACVTQEGDEPPRLRVNRVQPGDVPDEGHDPPQPTAQDDEVKIVKLPPMSVRYKPDPPP